MSLFGHKVANFCTYCKKEGHKYRKYGKRPNNTLARTLQAQSSQAPQLGNALPNAGGPRFVQPNSQSRKTTSTKRSRVQADSRSSSPENGPGQRAQKKSGNKGKGKQTPPKAPVKTPVPPITKAQGKASAAEDGTLNKPATMTFVPPLLPATLIAPPGVHPFIPLGTASEVTPTEKRGESSKGIGIQMSKSENKDTPGKLWSVAQISS
ncbi:hypothetical protein EV175_000950 [Coemansia sp. RSA 1933]|nr:hypothetical protein EV175_000950 [Coemansia sp. RSA 1933]